MWTMPPFINAALSVSQHSTVLYIQSALQVMSAMEEIADPQYTVLNMYSMHYFT